MFTFDATPVKFVGLLIMFAFTTAWGLYELTRPADRRARTGGVLHLWMSVVMLLMVSRTLWQPFVRVVPIWLIALTQAASVAWFVAQAIRERGNPPLARHFVAHAMMFGAMTWHLIAMAVKMPHMGPDMQRWMMAESRPGGVLWIAALAGVPFMLWLLGAGLYALIQAVGPVRSADHGHEHHGHERHDRAAGARQHEADALAPAGARVAVAAAPLEVAGFHEPRVIGTPTHRLGRLHDAAMNLGMFWMSTGLVVPIAPFMAALAF